MNLSEHGEKISPDVGARNEEEDIAARAHVRSGCGVRLALASKEVGAAQA